tara:strand:- start:2408 stop:4036 length:1629 start_codon:yes stop_codon:yes gene_type:complete
MPLNPFFLQGSSSEQKLVQDLINEHLSIHGLDVTYIPRKMVNRATIIEEVTTSKFDDNFLIEAYVNTYEGYAGQGDIMSKFGVQIEDEVTLTISKERFEDFISAFLQVYPTSEIEVTTRPREGDLIYFPLGGRLFEVKFVEHEVPFYQLGQNYVYELKCELFEYEDEVIDTGIEEIDESVEEEGYITTLTLVSAGSTAKANAIVGTGFIDNLYLVHDGSGYSSTPQVAISTDSTTTTPATAVAITTVRAGVQSIERLVLTNAGRGYSTIPTVTIIGGGGSGGIATASIQTGTPGIVGYTMTDNGDGYGKPAPNVTITDSSGSGASAEAVVVDSKVMSLRVLKPGTSYSSSPTISIANPLAFGGAGNYEFNEQVRGVTSGTIARVKEWDFDTKTLKVSQVGIGTTVSGFIPGEAVEGLDSTVFTEYASPTNGDIAGYGITVITGITTTNIEIGHYFKPIANVIGAGSSVTQIETNTVYISDPTINTSYQYNVNFSIGTKLPTSYSVKAYDDRDIYDEYDSNDEFEDAADDILDFSQSNPFGTF